MRQRHLAAPSDSLTKHENRGANVRLPPPPICHDSSPRSTLERYRVQCCLPIGLVYPVYYDANGAGSVLNETSEIFFTTMTGLFGIMDGYENFMKTFADPRTSNWFLSGKLGHLLIILVTYLYFCTKAGPKYMRDRKPYELKRTIQIYNLIQVFASMFLVYQGLISGWATDYKFSCQPVVPGEKGMMMANGVWYYFFFKLTELLDTVFFVLRKKYNQVTYLHLYHHTLMPICAWIGLTFVPGGHATLLGLINSFIHVIMYAYYFLSSLGPQYQKYLWWKRHLTKMQMVQFGIIFVHNFQVLFRECEYPKTLNVLLCTQAAYFTFLFGRFYVKQYLRNGRRKVGDRDGDVSCTNNNESAPRKSNAGDRIKSN